MKSFVEFTVSLLTIGAWVVVVLMLPDSKGCTSGDAGQGGAHPYSVPASQPIGGCGAAADRRTSLPRLDERRSP